MTVLTAYQQAAKLLAMAETGILYTSTDEFPIQMQAVANESAKAIARAHDWRKFSTLKTEAGDGSTTAFDLPDDYDRMPLKAAVYLTSSQVPLRPVETLNDWLEISLQGFSGAAGWWIILGGQLNVTPAVGASDSVKYYYQSNLIVDPVSGSDKVAFTLDTDSYRLPEYLLTLDMIWRWRSLQGIDYQQERANFEIAMAQAVSNDKGRRVINIGQGRLPAGVSLAYPGTIVP